MPIIIEANFLLYFLRDGRVFHFPNYVSCVVGDKVLPKFKMLERYLRLQYMPENITTPLESNSEVK